MAETDQNRELLTPAEVAVLLSVDQVSAGDSDEARLRNAVRTVKTWARRGKLQPVRLGRNVLITRASVKRLLSDAGVSL